MEHLDILSKKIAAAAQHEKPRLFVEFCEQAIAAFNPKTFREEAVGYAICGIAVRHNLDENTNPLFEAVRDLACDMEIPRESSAGSSIHLDEDWNSDRANAFKQHQFKELTTLIEKIKTSVTT